MNKIGILCLITPFFVPRGQYHLQVRYLINLIWTQLWKNSCIINSVISLFSNHSASSRNPPPAGRKCLCWKIKKWCTIKVQIFFSYNCIFTSLQYELLPWKIVIIDGRLNKLVDFAFLALRSFRLFRFFLDRFRYPDSVKRLHNNLKKETKTHIF